MYPEFPAFADLSRPTHPGTVTFIGPDGTERVELADQIPEWLKFAPGADGTAVPVVRVVRMMGEQGYSLRSYGADGQLLWVGMTVPAAPTAQADSSTGLKASPRAPRPSRMPVSRPVSRNPSVAEPTGWF